MTNRIRLLTQVSLISLFSLYLAGCGADVGETRDPVEAEAFFPEPSEEWQLVWSDEFDGDTLDASKWGYDLGDGSDRGLVRWGNNEQQWYTNQNTSVSDGTLKITALNESVQEGFPYTSSRITTLGKLDFKYGRVEASIKSSAGQGLWGAFWMLSSDSPYGSDGWAATGEIDIMEAANPGVDTEFFGSTIFHGFPWPLQQSLTERMPDGLDPTDFNEYAVEWEQNEIRFFINDIHFKTITSDSYYSYYYNDDTQQYELAVDGAPFDTEFYLILNLAVGGNLTGNSVEDSSLPGELEVDYVRVYECAYGRPDGAGCNSNVDPNLETPDPLRPAIESFDIYIDAPATYTWTIVGETYVRPLAVNSFFDNEGALSFQEVEFADRGNVIEVTTTNGGNISINPTDGDPIALFGMGNNPSFAELHAGEIRFDIYVRSADAESSFLVKMDSGFPALGQVALNADDLPRDQWTTISVKVNDLLAFRGEGFDPLDTSSIQSMFVFEPTGAADVLLDNITLSCGSPGGCGIVAPVPPAPPIEGPFAMAGIWAVAPEAGSLGVGPSRGDITWFAIDDAGVSTRSCFYDDTYVFNEDGSFENVLGDETWLEQWQTGNAEACGAPLSPYDGMVPGTWSYDADAGTLVIDGFGSYVGIPKAVNAGELPNVQTPPNVTYIIEEIGNDRMNVIVEAGSGVWWQVVMQKLESFGDPGPAPERTFAGTWQIEPVAGSLGVGPSRGDIGWFAIDEAGVTTRSCFYDDEYVFERDGTFDNVLGDETWLETWQGVASDSCGAPVAPHDGAGDYTWTYTQGDTEDEGTLVIDGLGGYLGIPKAVNGGEVPNVPVPANITYLVTWENDNTVIIDVEIQDGAYWRYRMIKTVQPTPLDPPPAASPVVGTWRVAPEANSLGVGPGMGDISWFAIDEAGVTTRACFFDDDYVFMEDGTFDNVLGDETWLEVWQGVAADSCGAPVAPHDGTAMATWELDEENGTLSILGAGAYLGIPKAVNGGELGNGGALTGTIEYMVTFNEDNTRMTLDIESGNNVWWRAVMEKQ